MAFWEIQLFMVNATKLPSNITKDFLLTITSKGNVSGHADANEKKQILLELKAVRFLNIHLAKNSTKSVPLWSIPGGQANKATQYITKDFLLTITSKGNVSGRADANENQCML